jgi:hypothetical protein
MVRLDAGSIHRTSRRQLAKCCGFCLFPPPAFGKGCHGGLARVAAWPCVGMRSSWCPKASVHI